MPLTAGNCSAGVEPGCIHPEATREPFASNTSHNVDVRWIGP